MPLFRSAARPRLFAALVLAIVLATGLVSAPAARAADPPIIGRIRDKWAALGGAAYFGRPVTPEVPTFDGVGRTQRFEWGNISWHPTIGAFSVIGDIWRRWESMGSERYGYPITDETTTPDTVGRFNYFRELGVGNRSIYWTPRTGAQTVWGAFLDQWSARGWETGWLGYPLSGELDPTDSRIDVRQNFQGGHMTWAGGKVTVVRYYAPRRTESYALLRCKFSDVGAEPQGPDYLRELFGRAGGGTGGWADYIADMSQGGIGVGEVELAGWFTIGTTLAQAKANPAPTADNCINAARNAGYTAPSGWTVVVLMNGTIPLAAATPGNAFFDGANQFASVVAHELLHALGLGHSFSNDLSFRAGTAAPGEYNDTWDQMSAGQIFPSPNRYGAGPVGLNAFNRRALGGLRSDQIRTLTPLLRSSTDVTLSPLDGVLEPNRAAARSRCGRGAARSRSSTAGASTGALAFRATRC